MRVGEFGVKNQAKVWVVFDFFVAKSDSSSLLDRVSTNNWVKDRINVLVNVLNKNRVSGCDSRLNGLEIIPLTKSDYDQLATLAVRLVLGL